MHTNICIPIEQASAHRAVYDRIKSPELVRTEKGSISIIFNYIFRTGGLALLVTTGPRNLLKLLTWSSI